MALFGKKKEKKQMEPFNLKKNSTCCQDIYFWLSGLFLPLF